jgi:hypothetical protein
MPNRSLSKDENEDAQRLRQLWKDKKDDLHLSQVKAAKELGYNSQGAVSQFLNGKVGLNFQAVAKFAKLLRVSVGDISPRFAHLVEKPIAPALDRYVAPKTGSLGGMNTDLTVDWFAFSKDFCASLGVQPENLKTVRLTDDSFKEFPIGTVFLVDDSSQRKPEAGVYLFQQDDSIVARRVTVDNKITISSGRGKNQEIDLDAFRLLRIIGRVVSAFSTTSKD